MGKFEDLTGRTFGRLTVIERAPNKTAWRCKCNCEHKAELVIRGHDLKSGHTQSCGCLHVEQLVARSTKHGLAHSKIHSVWNKIKDRCTNPNNKEYHNYGGRGISMFEGWANDFSVFYDYVSKLPHFGELGYSLDRINNDGNYEPGNVRWADPKTQSRNARKNVFVEYEGREMTLAEVAEKTGIKHSTLYARYRRGDRGERLFRPVEKI